MKELTIEEKAKRYDEAIEIAKSNYDAIVGMDENCTFARSGIINTFHHIFPELKESEDEKLREQVVYAINQLPVCEWTKNKLLAWLEKQGEQKQPTKYTLEQAAHIFLDALSNTPYNNKPVTDAQVITGELLKFLSDVYSYNPNAINKQNPAWSEEDENNASFIVAALDSYYRVRKDNNNENGQEKLEKAVNWIHNRLKYISPKIKQEWKPSDGQIQALEFIVHFHTFATKDTREEMETLLNDIKKLREE